jgi:hypothetical protein
LDGLLPLLTSVTVSAWLASWLMGHAYGIEVEAWWGIPSADEWGQVASRWPTQLVGAISTLGIYWGLDQIRIRKWLLLPGVTASGLVGLITLVILILTPYRGDPAPFYNGIRMDSWAALAFMILSFIMGILFWLKSKTNELMNE